MSNSTAVMTLGKHTGLIPPQNPNLRSRHERVVGHLVPRQQKVLARVALQKVCLGRLTEGDGVDGLCAEEDDIVKVATFGGDLFRRRRF